MSLRTIVQYTAVGFAMAACVPRTGNVADSVVLFDEGHNNFHTSNGSYAAYMRLLEPLGFSVVPLRVRVSAGALKTADIFISANPFSEPRDTLVERARQAGEPFRWSAAASRSAFTAEEVVVVQSWVRSGGALLLILDHAPHGITGGILAEAFGVAVRNVETYDSLNAEPADAGGGLVFLRSRGRIGSHPTTIGVNKVVTYLGLSLAADSSAAVLLRLDSTAVDREWNNAERTFIHRPARDRAQAVALQFGRGRVVVLGEAGMFAANPGSSADAQGVGGILRSDTDNRRFATNIMTWLARRHSRPEDVASNVELLQHPGAQ